MVRLQPGPGIDPRATSSSSVPVVPFNSADYATYLHKFGSCADVDTGAVTDVHSGASGSARDYIAPTAARIHTLVSDDVNDDQVLRVSYLPTWSTNEATEDVTLNGTTGVPMSASAVFIHRIQTITPGTSTPLPAGTVTATAATDATVTAQVEPDIGQTEMAIYGIPSTKVLLVTMVYGGLRDGGANADLYFELAFNPFPDQDETAAAFILKNYWIVDAAVGFNQRTFVPPVIFPGPGILKIRCASGAVNTEVVAGFDGFLVDA